MTAFLVVFAVIGSVLTWLWHVFVNAFSILPLLMLLWAIPPYRSDGWNGFKLIMTIWLIYHFWS